MNVQEQIKNYIANINTDALEAAIRFGFENENQSAA